MANASSFPSFNYKLINTDLSFGLIGNLHYFNIFNVLLILLTCVTKHGRYFNRFIRTLSYNVTFLWPESALSYTKLYFIIYNVLAGA